jgi:hypothetical protein
MIYRELTLQVNRAWLELVKANMTAKIEIVLGQQERERTQRAIRGGSETLHLWTKPTVSLELVFEDYRRQVITHIYILVDHPEFFFHNWIEERGDLMDMHLSVALAISGVLPGVSSGASSGTSGGLTGDVTGASRDVVEDAPPSDGNDMDQRVESEAIDQNGNIICRGYLITFFGNRARKWKQNPENVVAAGGGNGITG